MSKKIIVLSIALFLLSLSSTFAETIVLKSGKTIEGKIVEKTDKSVKVDVEGIPITYYLEDIISIDGKLIDIIKQPSPKQTSVSSTDEMESRFKNISSQIAKEFSQTVSPEGKQYEVSEKQREDNFSRQSRLFKEWQEELRNLIKANPKSIWADDAQYIIATLNAANPKKQALELEYLLKEYPNMHIEDWTRENLAIIMPNPKIPFEIIVRLQLCSDYKQSGDTAKLKQMCEESMKKYPDKAKIFEKLLQENTTTPK